MEKIKRKRISKRMKKVIFRNFQHIHKVMKGEFNAPCF